MKAAHSSPHFLPAPLFLITQLPFLPRALGGSWSLPHLLPPDLSRLVGQLVVYGLKRQVIIYWLISWRLVYRHQRYIRLIAATIQHINLTWLYGLLATIASMIGLWLTQVFLPQSQLDPFIGYGYLGIIFLMSYFLIRQPEVFAFSQREACQSFCFSRVRLCC